MSLIKQFVELPYEKVAISSNFKNNLDSCIEVANEGFFDLFKKKKEQKEKVEYNDIHNLNFVEEIIKKELSDSSTDESFKIYLKLNNIDNENKLFTVLKSFEDFLKSVDNFYKKDVLLFSKRVEVCKSLFMGKEDTHKAMTLLEEAIKIYLNSNPVAGMTKSDKLYYDKFKTIAVDTHDPKNYKPSISGITKIKDIVDCNSGLYYYVSFKILDSQSKALTLSKSNHHAFLEIALKIVNLIIDLNNYVKKSYESYASDAYKVYDTLLTKDKENDFIGDVYGLSQDFYQGHLLNYLDDITDHFLRMFKTFFDLVDTGYGLAKKTDYEQ